MCFAERTRHTPPLIVLAAAVLLTGGTSSAAQTVWGGAYTDAQAARGLRRYQASCASCHDDGPRRGEAFMRDWFGSDVEALFRRIRASMPPGAPGSLPDADYLDIVAWMLQLNAFPAGPEDLAVERIAGLRIEGRNGPEPVPNFTLVRVVGCLGSGPGTDWTLTGASEPIRTKNPAASRDEELSAAGQTALGAGAFRLMNVYPRPDAYAGHRVEAKGFLIRNPGDDRINATSVQTLAPACPAPAPRELPSR